MVVLSTGWKASSRAKSLTAPQFRSLLDDCHQVNECGKAWILLHLQVISDYSLGQATTTNIEHASRKYLLVSFTKVHARSQKDEVWPERHRSFPLFQRWKKQACSKMFTFLLCHVRVVPIGHRLSNKLRRPSARLPFITTGTSREVLGMKLAAKVP